MATLTPDLTKVTCAWAGVNTDGSPALGRLIIRYQQVMLDDGTQPISIYPNRIELPLVEQTIGGVRVGYATIDLPASNDPDVFGSGGVYVVDEDLLSNKGVTRTGVVDHAASGVVWLNRFAVTPSVPTVPVSYDNPVGQVFVQQWNDTKRRFVPTGGSLMILGGTAAQKPSWALPGDLYAATS